MRLDHFDQFDTNINMLHGDENHKVMACVKVLLVLFNAICLVTGVLLVYSGISVLALYAPNFLRDPAETLIGPSILVLSGTLVTAIAFMGIVGVLKESVCMILSFSFVLGIIFMFEISICLTGVVYQTEIADLLSHSMSEAITLYPNDSVSIHAVDTIQYQLSCCGAEGPYDWHAVHLPGADVHDGYTRTFDSQELVAPLSGQSMFLNGDETTVSVFRKRPLYPHPFGQIFSYTNETAENTSTARYPVSCCEIWSGSECERLQTAGCLDRLDSIMRLSGRALMLVVMAVGIVQFLGILFACSLGKLIRRHKTERENLRWEFRNHIMQARSPANFDSMVRDGQMDNKKL